MNKKKEQEEDQGEPAQEAEEEQEHEEGEEELQGQEEESSDDDEAMSGEEDDAEEDAPEAKETTPFTGEERRRRLAHEEGERAKRGRKEEQESNTRRLEEAQEDRDRRKEDSDVIDMPVAAGLVGKDARWAVRGIGRHPDINAVEIPGKLGGKVGRWYLHHIIYHVPQGTIGRLTHLPGWVVEVGRQDTDTEDKRHRLVESVIGSKPLLVIVEALGGAPKNMKRPPRSC